MSNKVFSLVIDADIARSSGMSEHPVSSGSRVLLENIARNGHKAAMCPILTQEWKKHKSLFATKWLASMVARKKVVFITPSTTIRHIIEENLSDEKEKEVALKDLHLVDAALEVDKMIASNDNIARSVFQRLTTVSGEVGVIAWFNAISDREFLSNMLASGSYVPQGYYLRGGV